MNEEIKATRLGNIYGDMKRFHTAYDGNVWDVGGVIPTFHVSSKPYVIVSTEEDKMLRIRKLVPAECFILMGFTKEDADKLSAAGISNTQLYKMAGNSIVVPVLEGIFKEVYKNG